MTHLDARTGPQAMPSRRAFLLAAAFAPEAFAQAPVQGFWEQPRWVWLHRPATGEEIRTVYWAQGNLIQQEYVRLCWFLRDVRAGKSMWMSPVLLDMLYASSSWLAWHGIARPITTTSGARFVQTNDKTEGAAKASLHLEGRAHDGYIPGVSLESMAHLGIWLGGGGVGYYPGKNFCHWDDGRVRFWRN
jgi:uncharacterized protein YcbK (DUF882 family)